MPYTPSQYQALPVAVLSSTFTSNTKVALGQLYDKVDTGASTPLPANDFSNYLTDGAQGLDTGVANAPAGMLRFAISSVVPAAIGIPAVLVSQIASPDNLGDQ